MLILILIVFGIISFAVSRKLKSKFRKYSQIPLSANLSGREIAELMLRDNGINDVKVISVEGQLTDHYNPMDKTVNLSPDVYHGRSAAAAAVAAHECGHAIQHATAYSMLEFRSAMVPIQNISAKILNIIFMVSIFGGMFLFSGSGGANWNMILLIIIGCYGVMTLFTFVTLPVEFDASKRALAWIKDRNIVNAGEHDMAKDALKWAAMTYVVVAIGSLVTLLYYISLFLGNRD
ncbi:zinc metallopeptidase [Penaeicola halotolerans]|uniref:zinc metallopeptidase n=1 Tax=Penaeicola halotolerans TaxID=2793196 RepID=UPI001CF90DA8|nr:zinc metallopeptidase [Penaeicola halotolerans]